MKHRNIQLTSFLHCSRAANARLRMSATSSRQPAARRCFAQSLVRASALLLMCACAAKSSESDKTSKSLRAANDARLAALKAYARGRYEEASQDLLEAVNSPSTGAAALPAKIQAQADLALIQQKHGDLVKARDNYQMAIASMQDHRLTCQSLKYVVTDYQQFLKANKMTDKDESESAPGQMPEYIGTAWITEDGTIRMRLRLPVPGGAGQTSLTYNVGDPHYDEILSHLGPIRPGEIVSVRPFD